MKTKIATAFKTLLILFIFIYQGLQSNILYAQITTIPDSNFEQALIDLGIDSDGIINGQVLTSDIDTVIILNVSNKGIDDLTGIEDFAALENLDVSNNNLIVLDLSNNLQLKELYGNNTGGVNLSIFSLDLSNNVNLELLNFENIFVLESLNLKNGNNSILTVRILCEFEGEACTLTELNCVMVDNEVAATNGDFPYSSWYIQADYVYSEDCILGVSTQKTNYFSVYPNPVKELLVISSLKNNTENIKINIYTIEGKLLQTQNINFNKQATINVSNFSKGIYFISIQNENGQHEVVKFVKK